MKENFQLFYSINRGVIYKPIIPEEHNIGDFIEINNKKYKIKNIEGIIIDIDPPIKKQIAFVIDMGKEEFDKLK